MMSGSATPSREEGVPRDAFAGFLSPSPLFVPHTSPNSTSPPLPTHMLTSGWWRSWQRWHPCRLVVTLSLALLILSVLVTPAQSIIQDYKANLVVNSGELTSQSFHGNESHVDYFRLLQRDGNSLLIGARNYVYNISMSDLLEHLDRRMEWVSRKTDSDMCFSKGKSEAECHNYIRVLAKKSEGEFLVCGTNAYKPTCRDYSLQGNGSFAYAESSGVGKSPYNPRHNSTFVFAEGKLYSGTVVDFQGMIPLIFRDPLKTDHSDYRQLNGPDFVHSFEYGDYVFFFFRETAVEYLNCGKRVYSRVARVCKGDRGPGQTRSNTMSTWTTYLKSRLNCSFPGNYPFYFDEIQSVSDVILGVYGGSHNEVIYAIFTTPQNSIPGSAVCSFSMRDVLDVFEGPFKEQKDLNSNWMPVPSRQVPEPRPGSCVNNSQSLPEENINFVRSHPLMDELVSPFLGKPLLMKASFEYRFTKLTVDPQVTLLNGEKTDVLFIATDVGVILKVINAPSEESSLVSAVVIEEIHAFDKPVSINNLQIASRRSSGDSSGLAKLIIITDSEVKAIPLARCGFAVTCGDCVMLQDPYCAWFPTVAECHNIEGEPRTKNSMQNVTSGVHNLCPDEHETNRLEVTASQVYTTEPPPPAPASSEADTCPPCVCDVSPSTPTPNPKGINPNPGNPENIDPTYENNLSDIPEVENEITPEGAEIYPSEIGVYSPNSQGGLPLQPRMPPGRLFPPSRHGRYPPAGSQYPRRSGKELHIGDPDNRDLNHISIAYSEGVTGPVIGASVGGPLIYSAETLAIAVTTACVAALVIGFISGFLFSRKCRSDDFPHFSETPYLDSKLSKCENTADPNMYTANNVGLAPPKQINNLVTNYNPKNVNAGKSNTNTTTDNKLIKQAKCAYI